MIPSHVHHFWHDEFGEASIVARSSAWHAESAEADLSTNLARWQELHRDHQTHLWTPGRIVQAARRSGLSLVADALLRSRSISQRADLAMLFVLWSVGGFWIDPTIRPLAACLHHYADSNLVRLSGAERLFMGANRRQQAVFRALGSITLKIHESDVRFSAAAALALHIRREAVDVLDLDPKSMWGARLERRRKPRLPHAILDPADCGLGA